MNFKDEYKYVAHDFDSITHLHIYEPFNNKGNE